MVEIRYSKKGKLQTRRVIKIIRDVRGVAWWQRCIEEYVWSEWADVPKETTTRSAKE